MAEGKQAIEYEFEDLRRNTDPLPSNVIAEFEVDEETGATTDADDTGDQDDPDDEEMVPVSEVNKRIARVRRESDRKITEATDEAGKEIRTLTGRLDKIEQQDEMGVLEYDHGTKVGQINLEIEKAMEDGDAKAVTRLTGELAEATAAVTIEREKLKHKRAADEHDDPDDLHDKDKPPAVIPRAKDWLSEQDWWDDPENAHVKRFVNRLDSKLQEKGYSPHDDDFYEQLEEAVENKYPGIIVRTMEDLDLDDDDEDENDEFDNIPDKRSASKKKARRAARRQPVGGKDAGSRGGKPRNRGRGKTLNRNQIANMKMFGMDPDDKEHVEAYLAEVK
jgi:hypothetical protein